MTAQPWGTAPDGRPVHLYTLRGRIEVDVTDFGGAIVSCRVGGRDVILGFDDLQGYLDDTAYLGVLAGRYANRIGGGRFTLDGKTHELSRNDGDNTLHGGVPGFHKQRWDATLEGNTLRLHLISPRGMAGFPGTLHAEALYTVEDDALRIELEAMTDAPTVVSLTSHGYFNLGDAAQIVDHELQILAERYTPVNDRLIPTGELRPVAGTPFDFRTPTAIGARIDADDEQIRIGGGYDHNFVLDGSGLRTVARVREPLSGLVMEVDTTKPGLQFYSGNGLDAHGRGGAHYGRRSGFCLETQHFPDAPNQPGFPSPVLRPGETYRHTTIYRFLG